MYDAIWDKLFEIVPALRANITTVTSDFERAQIKSAKSKFPNARISGCLFHFKQVSIIYTLLYLLLTFRGSGSHYSDSTHDRHLTLR